MNLKPLHDLIIVKPLPHTQTPAGLYLPETVSLNIKNGIVMAISDGARSTSGDLVPLMVSVGDQVMFTGDGIEIKQKDLTGEEQTYLILREGDIFCKLIPDQNSN